MKDCMTSKEDITVTSAVFLDGISGDDRHDGITPKTAVATFEAAFALLSDSRNTIVVISDTDAPKMLPPSKRKVRITSLCSPSAKKHENAVINIEHTLTLSCDTQLDNVKIKGASGSKICCGYNSVTFGINIETVSEGEGISIVGGYYVDDIPLINEGALTAEDVSFDGRCEISVLSGSWGSYIGGNYRRGYNSPVGTFRGEMTLNIKDDATFTSKGRWDDVEAHCISGICGVIAKGKVSINISGGKIGCSVYSIGHLGKYYNKTAANGMKGTDGLAFGNDVTSTVDTSITITGGDFTSDNAGMIGAVQISEDAFMHGRFSLSVKGGAMREGIIFSGWGVIGETELLSDVSLCDHRCFSTVNEEKQTAYKAPIRIACCGDSITHGTCTTPETIGDYCYRAENFSYPANLQKAYGTSAVIGNFGYPGANVKCDFYCKYYQSSAYNMFLSFDPDIIIVALGTNNCGFMPSGYEDYETAYGIMIDDMHRAYPNAKIILTLPLYRWDSDERTQQVTKYIHPVCIKTAGEREWVTLYDSYKEFLPYATSEYYKDKLHPNNMGYVELSRIMKKATEIK